MLLKWIICRVTESNRAAFHDAQQAWRALADADGFRGQAGGWDRDAPETAVILAHWAHAPAYRTFMRDIHDTITDGSGQAALYESSRIELFELLFGLPGPAGLKPVFPDDAGNLRIETCDVHFNRQAHFVAAHQETRFPGLSSAEGLLGGGLFRSCDTPSRFLTATWWRNAPSESDHAAPELADVRSIESRVIEPDRSWWVRPDG